jgi:hypothetical protein
MYRKCHRVSSLCNTFTFMRIMIPVSFWPLILYFESKAYQINYIGLLIHSVISKSFLIYIFISEFNRFKWDIKADIPILWQIFYNFLCNRVAGPHLLLLKNCLSIHKDLLNRSIFKILILRQWASFTGNTD